MHMMHLHIVSFYTFFTNPFEDEELRSFQLGSLRKLRLLNYLLFLG